MQEHRNHVAASWREAPSFPQITTARPPAPGILRYWQTCSLPGHPVYLISMLHDHRARKRCFLARLAELRRLKLISQAACPTLGNVHDPRLPFHATCRKLLRSE